MKSCLKWVAIIGVIVLVIVLVFLQSFLGKTIKKVVEENADQFLTAKVEIADLDFNILGGSVDIKGLKVHNPAGFTGDYLYKLERSKEDLGLMALIDGEIVIEEITIKNSDLFISRNKEGKLNVSELVKKTEKKEEASAEEKPAEEKASTEKTEEIELPPFLLEKMDISATLDYLDEKIAEEPFKIGFITKIASRNLGTIGPETQKGTLSIKGHLRDSENEFVTDINLEMPPLTDLKNPTFDLKSEIKEIDMKRLEVYKEITGIEEGKLSITSRIVCVKGIIDKEKSTQTISIKGLKVTDKLKEEKLKGIDPPADLQFTVHVFGSMGLNNYENIKTDAFEQFVKELLDPKSLIGGKLQEGLKDKFVDKLEGSPLGGFFGGKDKKEGDTKKGNAKEEGKSPLGGMMDGLKEKGETTSDDNDAKIEDKKSGLGSLLGGLGEKKEEEKEDSGSDAKEEKKKSPLGGLKKLF